MSKKSFQAFFDRFNRRAFCGIQNAASPKKPEKSGFFAAGYWIARIALRRCLRQMKARRNFRSRAVCGPSQSRPANGIAARRAKGLGLAEARSRCGSDMPPACHSLPQRRFATPRAPPRLYCRQQKHSFLTVSKTPDLSRPGVFRMFYALYRSSASCRRVRSARGTSGPL